MNRRSLMQAALCAATALGAASAHAQAYPSRPVSVVVPFATGSASDVFTRVVLDHMASRGTFRFVVDNKPAAGGNVGTQQVAKATPDGYTLVMSSSGPLAANKILVKNLGYDPEKDFDPIALFAVVPNVIVVTTKLPIKSLQELVAYAKSKPNALNYGSVGIGSSQHIAGAFFEQITSTQMVHVPYRVTSQMVTDMISGQVQLGFQLLPNVKGMIDGGQMRPLAVASSRRLTALPDVPTAQEAGVAGYESAAWFAFLAPRGTPRAAIDRFHAELAITMADPAVRTRLSELGAIATINKPEELGRHISSEIAKLREIITKAGITLDGQ
ncbi:MAG: Bug family tripartite tricarboxylate transporter substrate binding protein [Betaproteobacteria bacterium]|jgi:tripartite-type tricarboxylate transporter receptor subunit TctC